MGKRYYCDYCDRSFVDELQARKKHLQGAAHVRTKKMHFANCRDIKTIIEEESAKEECFKNKKTGQCPFGENCYRSHYTREHLRTLKQQAEEQEREKKLQAIGELKTVDSWLEERNTLTMPCGSSDTLDSIYSTPYIPLESKFYKSLPPSLRRLDLTNFIDTEIPEWG